MQQLPQSKSHHNQQTRIYYHYKQLLFDIVHSLILKHYTNLNHSFLLVSKYHQNYLKYIFALQWPSQFDIVPKMKWIFLTNLTYSLFASKLHHNYLIYKFFHYYFLLKLIVIFHAVISVYHLSLNFLLFALNKIETLSSILHLVNCS